VRFAFAARGFGRLPFTDIAGDVLEACEIAAIVIDTINRYGGPEWLAILTYAPAFRFKTPQLLRSGKGARRHAVHHVLRGVEYRIVAPEDLAPFVTIEAALPRSSWR
jgi:hypothetical protein